MSVDAPSGWSVCFTQHEPQQGQHVLVLAPDIQERFIVCYYRGRQYIPLNPDLEKAYLRGEFIFTPCWWHTIADPITVASSLHVAAEWARPIFQVGHRVCMHSVCAEHTDSLRRQVHGHGTVLKIDKFPNRHFCSYFIQFDQTDCYYGQHWVGEEFLIPAHIKEVKHHA